MHVRAHDDEWEQVWATYDQTSADAMPAVPPVAAAPVVRGVRERGRGGLLLGALLLALLPAATQPPLHAPLQVLAAADSLSPVEALLPPLAVALGRLAGESDAAACFALSLRPGGGACRP
ncbi:hypothetical protein [Paracraurococcus lichenis]|uniref:Uncharacterized protein n=1 Tax=Paracraurococcus lichenis TaxID=3064888 RepID=A0ABT9E0Y3_9PROT|nr:hypothetical protein [Paracraurococcus sp. LOR1-02]MDO9709782.1 hypothetical protein [Paracraurococcus sp. LOR1-02]